jgi:hypothetical protein
MPVYTLMGERKRPADGRCPGRSGETARCELTNRWFILPIRDAERMKASLALKGIRAHIEKVSVNDKTYYRVRSGPYNRDQAYSLHTRLKSRNIDSLVIRIKQ